MTFENLSICTWQGPDAAKELLYGSNNSQKEAAWAWDHVNKASFPDSFVTLRGVGLEGLPSLKELIFDCKSGSVSVARAGSLDLPGARPKPEQWLRNKKIQQTATRLLSSHRKPVLEKKCDGCNVMFNMTKLMRCPCNRVFYHDKDCQRQAWGNHKKAHNSALAHAANGTV